MDVSSAALSSAVAVADTARHVALRQDAGGAPGGRCPRAPSRGSLLMPPNERKSSSVSIPDSDRPIRRTARRERRAAVSRARAALAPGRLVALTGGRRLPSPPRSAQSDPAQERPAALPACASPRDRPARSCRARRPRPPATRAGLLVRRTGRRRRPARGVGRRRGRSGVGLDPPSPCGGRPR